MEEIDQSYLDEIRRVRDQRLKRLDLSNKPWEKNKNRRKLGKIPEKVFELTWIEVLDLSSNQLTTLPESISRLQNLTRLYLSYNQLTTLPESISRLQNLTRLYLSYNQLTTLPESISRLQNLTGLDLSDNQLTTLPESISRLQNLTRLYLSDNQLTTLPESISRLQNLTVLDLSDNQLTTLPESISRLQNLTRLDLSDNPIQDPPPEIVNRGINAIRSYFSQLKEEGEDTLYEAKLLIVGEPGSGKTTLSKKIVDQNYQLQDEDSTEGISIKHFEFPIDSEHNFRINIWDFGGQEIYHATHQFFLTKRSLYVLVSEQRREDTDFNYWLRIVELLADESPLIILKNKRQDRNWELNERELRGNYLNLKEIVAINLANAEEIPQITEPVKYLIRQLPHVGTRLPKTWIRVRETLERDPRNYIPVKTYLEICKENGFTTKDRALQLSSYLHDLGVFLHFQDDPLLSQWVILKPTWGTAAVYRVLDHSAVIYNQGEFTWRVLQQIWDDESYANMQPQLLQLMINFQLCYEIPDQRHTYIAPQLLTKSQPDYPPIDPDHLILRYTYGIMPKGILTRFIVAMHKQIADQRYVWRTGVILKSNQARAEVIERYSQRQITIKVEGPYKRDLLIQITHELDKIHDSFNRLIYDKWVPCRCSQCQDPNTETHFFTFENLRRRYTSGQPTVQCDLSYERVDVSKLIEGVADRTQLIRPRSDWDHDTRNEVKIDHVGQLTINQGSPPMPPTDPTPPPDQTVRLPSAFRNGSFYLLVFVVVFNILGIFALNLPIYSFILTVIGSLLLILAIGALQLKQDDRLSETGFLQLMGMVLEQLPLLGNLIHQFKSGGNKHPSS